MAEPTKIGILAAPGAGATSWIGALALSARHDRADSLHVHGLDGDSVEYLQEAAAALRRRETLPHESLLHDIRFHAHSDHFDADFHLVDPDGPTVERSLRSLEDKRLEPLFEHLVDSPVLWLFLDPGRDLANPDAAEQERRLSALMTLFAERRKRAARKPGAPTPDLAVVLTKMEAHPKVRTSEQARRFATKLQPAFFAKLNRHSHRMRFFATSAFGKEKDAPFGVEAVLEWTTESLHRRRLTPLRRRIVIAISSVAVLAASFWTWRIVDRAQNARVLENETLSKTERIAQTAGAAENLEDARQRLFRERLDELTTELASDVGDERLQEILRELNRLGRSRPGRSLARLEEVQRTAERRREDRILAEIRDAAEHQRPNLDALVEKFHRDFPNSDRRSDVEEWRRGFLDRELQSARTGVRLVVAVDAPSLERKTAAIRDFLQRYGDRLDKDELARIQRAAVLGARFAQSSVYRVRLKRSGNLTLPRVQHVKVIVEGNPVREFIAPAPTTTATWDKTCDVSWRAGDRASAILVSQSRNWVNYSYYIVAERTEEDLFALRALSSLGPVQLRDEWVGIFNNGQAYLDLEIEGIDADDWRIASEYLAPGDKW
jgi:hypothetical protein